MDQPATLREALVKKLASYVPEGHIQSFDGATAAVARRVRYTGTFTRDLPNESTTRAQTKATVRQKAAMVRAQKCRRHHYYTDTISRAYSRALFVPVRVLSRL